MDTEYPKEKVYVTVIAYIKQLVQDGQLEFGGKLPSEREMMATLGLSRNSIREALRTLENMGLLSCIHGKGNYLVNQIGESFSSVFSMLLFLKQSNFDEVQQLQVNPKFCVNSIQGANRAKFIWGGSWEKPAAVFSTT